MRAARPNAMAKRISKGRFRRSRNVRADERVEVNLRVIEADRTEKIVTKEDRRLLTTGLTSSARAHGPATVKYPKQQRGTKWIRSALLL
jgi:hypothetical protein